ncbi:unnamed protein product [Didymodactylos carnosus]|uniref:F-box domain-containing protein n=1 Tax=Didymodactylos carnosus TaxID=1234261 RepID=A0A8S2DQN1_9BILA|nr:unnamed protein product [Didymodactylos carnosus]CAF3774548.1 unnamed protein product [Didymodactylos carnosus]
MLPNELLFEIFCYLRAIDIIKAFYPLNFRFDSLIANISIDIDLADESIYTADLKNIIPRFVDQVKTLSVWDTETYNRFKNVYVSIDKCQQLRSLDLLGIGGSCIRDISFKLKFFPLLSSFYIRALSECSLGEMQVLYQAIFNNPTLKTLLITYIKTDEFNDISILNGNNIQKLKVKCAFAEFQKLLTIIPKIKYLMVDVDCSTNQGANVPSNLSLSMPNLIYLSLNAHLMEFVYIEYLLAQLSSLKQLLLELTDYGKFSYTDAWRWEKVLSSINNFDLTLPTAAKPEIKADERTPTKFDNDQEKSCTGQKFSFKELKSRNTYLKQLSDNDPNLSNRYLSLGNIAFERDQIESAHSNYVLALDLERKSQVVDHDRLASMHISLGTVFLELKDYMKSIDHYSEALDLYQNKLHGDNRVKIATVLFEYWRCIFYYTQL